MEIQIDKYTFERSFDLIRGVKEETFTHLFEKKHRDDKDIIDDVDEAIKELESWKRVILIGEERE